MSKLVKKKTSRSPTQMSSVTCAGNTEPGHFYPRPFTPLRQYSDKTSFHPLAHKSF